MEWVQVLVIIAAMTAMFLWNRSEANSDRNMMLDLMKSMEKDMRDFHGRLCAIESDRRTIEAQRKDQEKQFLEELKQLLTKK